MIQELFSVSSSTQVLRLVGIKEEMKDHRAIENNIIEIVDLIVIKTMKEQEDAYKDKNQGIGLK